MMEMEMEMDFVFLFLECFDFDLNSNCSSFSSSPILIPSYYVSSVLFLFIPLLPSCKRR